MIRKQRILASVLTSIFATAAIGQSPGVSNKSKPVIEEIIVTAQKREQSINDVGLSISAADAEQLANAGVYDVGDLAKIVPGMTLSAAIMGNPTITLRGIGFNGFTLGSSPAVSVYVDQIPLPFMQMTRGTSLDLERVEVLKGPQGILFGQNSTGGAVNYIAAKPTDEFKGAVSLAYGRFDETHVEAFVNGALSQSVDARFSLRTDQGGAWQKSYTRDDELGDKDFTTARLLLNWEVSDRTNILFNFNGWRDRSDSQAAQFIGARLQNPGDPNGDAVAQEKFSRGQAIEALPTAANNARAANWNDGLGNEHSDNYIQVSMKADIDLTDMLTLTSITSYDNLSQDFSFDRDGTELSLIDIVSNNGDIQDFTQELRLAGDTDIIHWVVGANYLRASTENYTQIGIGDSTNTAVPTNASFGPWTSATQYGAHEIEEYAVFGNVDYLLTDSVTLSAGVRYTESDKDFEGCTSGDASITALQSLISTGFSDPLAITPGDCVTLDPAQGFAPLLVKDNLTEDNTSWRLGVNYQPNDELLLYTNIAKGFKSGSFPVLSAPNAIQLEPVTQEEVLAYEAGFKWTLPVAATQLNGAVFYYDYADKQVRGNVVAPPFGVLEKLVNVPESHVQGAELQLISSPFSGLTASLSGTYLNTEVDKYIGLDGNGNNVDLSGSIIPFTPTWQVVADVEYRFPIKDGLEVFFGGSATRNSPTNSSIGEPDNGRIRDFTVIDLRAGFASIDGVWQVSAYGRNVTDEYYWNNNFASQDVEVRFAAKPVTYGIRVDYRF